MTSLLCGIVLSCLVTLPGAKPIDELTYGTALYAWYQQDYGQALLEVMVAQQRGRTGDDPVRFQLAKGSFAFQEGLHRLAGQTFADVAQTELTELDRMRLAFHLAREHYRRGDWPAVQAELERIDLGADRRGRVRRHPEVEYLRAEAALGRGELVVARQALDGLSDDSVWRAYGLFNLGVAERAAGAHDLAYESFRQLASIRATSEPAGDLVQRGRLALAIMARQRGDALDAERLLRDLPGESRYRDVAMLSYGNLAMARGEHELAARIWLTLLDQDGWSRGYGAAQLGLPMSLEQLASPRHALDRYRQAAEAFEGRLTALERTVAQADDPAWLGSLLDALALGDEAQRARALAAVGDELGVATWVEWLSGEDVHRVLSEWRELTAMAEWLAGLPVRIAAYEEVTREGRRRAAEARALLGAERLTVRRDALATRAEQLERDLAMLEQHSPHPTPHWMKPLASPAERALIDQLDAMARLAPALPAAQRPQVDARIRRLRGLVFWQIADERSARMRALAKGQDANRALLAQIDQRTQRLAGAEARFAAGVETDFVALTARSSSVTGQVARAREERRRIIAAALRQGLDEELGRTRDYLLAARVAVARAADRLASGSATAPDGQAAGASGS